MKSLILGLLFLVTVGCTAQTTAVRTQPIVVIPDRSLFVCPTISQFPNPETLTDEEVARLLVQLYRNNVTCKRNMDAILNTLQQARRVSAGN